MKNPLGLIRNTGVHGAWKSVYTSYAFTSELNTIVLHSNVITDLSPQSDFEIENQFKLGVSPFDASDPNLTCSKLSTAPRGKISHTGDRSARIGPGTVLRVEGEFAIGDSYINSHSRIICGEEITIGDGVAIAWNCDILDDDRHNVISDGTRHDKTAPITIEDDVWVGHGVSINKGVTIGKGSIVANGSVVVNDVPANTLVAGVPATIKEENVSWE